MAGRLPRYSGKGKRERHGRIEGRAGVKLRKRRMERSHWLCEHCKAKDKTVVAEFVDHIKPLALGGKDIDENTRNLCGPCHDVVTTEQFGHRKRSQIGLDGWPVANETQ